MAKFERYDGNVVPFASNSTDDNRTIFGDDTQSDDINDNLNDDFKLGWEIVDENENPTKQDFNAMGYTNGYLTSYLYQQGIPEWNSNQTYYTNSYAVGSDGLIYRSKNDDNTDNDPTTDDGTNWEGLQADNADKLDGLDSTQFLRSDEDDTMEGNLKITETLQVNSDSDETTIIQKNEIKLYSNKGDDTERYLYINKVDDDSYEAEIRVKDKDGNTINGFKIKELEILFNKNVSINDDLRVSEDDRHMLLHLNEAQFYSNKDDDGKQTKLIINKYDNSIDAEYKLLDEDDNEVSILKQGSSKLEFNDKQIITDTDHDFSENGYQKLGNGLIYQWGIVDTDTGDNTVSGTANFNITFPNTCFQVTVVPINKPADDWGVIICRIEDKTASDFDYYLDTTDEDYDIDNNVQLRYIAIGY